MDEYAVEAGVMSIGASAVLLPVRGTIFKSRVVESPAFFAEMEIEVIAKLNIGDCTYASVLLMYISLLWEDAKCAFE